MGFRPSAVAVAGGLWNDRVSTQALPVAAAQQDNFSDGVLDPAWTLVQPSGTQVPVESGDVLSVDFTAGGILANDLAAYVRPIPAACLTAGVMSVGARVEMAFRYWSEVSPGSFPIMGLILSDGAVAGSNIFAHVIYQNGAFGHALWETWPGTFTATGARIQFDQEDTITANRFPWHHMRTRLDAANSWDNLKSSDGISFRRWQIPSARVLAPTHYGFCWSNFQAVGDVSVMSVDYIRIFAP